MCDLCRGERADWGGALHPSHPSHPSHASHANGTSTPADWLQQALPAAATARYMRAACAPPGLRIAHQLTPAQVHQVKGPHIAKVAAPPLQGSAQKRGEDMLCRCAG